MLHAGLLKSQ